MTHKHTHVIIPIGIKSQTFFISFQLSLLFQRNGLIFVNSINRQNCFSNPTFLDKYIKFWMKSCLLKEKQDIVCSQVKNMGVLDVSEPVLYLTVQVEQGSVSEREFYEWLRLNCSLYSTTICAIWASDSQNHVVLTMWWCDHTHQV